MGSANNKSEMKFGSPGDSVGLLYQVSNLETMLKESFHSGWCDVF